MAIGRDEQLGASSCKLQYPVCFGSGFVFVWGVGVPHLGQMTARAWAGSEGVEARPGAWSRIQGCTPPCE